MRQFTDEQGRVWDVAIDVTTLRAVRDAAKLNLALVVTDDGETFSRLADDPITLADVLAVICRRQMDERKLSMADFERLLTGEVLDAASLAVLEEVAGFFGPAKRAALERMMAADRQWRERQLTAPSDPPPPDAPPSDSSTASTSLPASSASTPAP
jgi:hypothetical protein